MPAEDDSCAAGGVCHPCAAAGWPAELAPATDHVCIKNILMQQIDWPYTRAAAMETAAQIENIS